MRSVREVIIIEYRGIMILRKKSREIKQSIKGIFLRMKGCEITRREKGERVRENAYL